MANTIYRGRFAPSPSGHLHFGSLIAAVGSYLQAKSQHGEWLVRMEDLDPPREMPGAADHILKTLDTYGFEWDGEVLYQSHRQQAYEATLTQLKQSGHLYPCACTRKEIAETAPADSGQVPYPGTCRMGLHGRPPRAWRVMTSMELISFNDAIQGAQSQILERDIGDFVLKRADGFYAYQLAVVVDDAAQGVTHIVRGADLLDSTPRQIWLQRLINSPALHYAHLPLAVNAEGEKLSKQTLATPLDLDRPAPLLWKALDFLGQQPPKELQNHLTDLWQWAKLSWQLATVPKSRVIMPPCSSSGL